MVGFVKHNKHMVCSFGKFVNATNNPMKMKFPTAFLHLILGVFLIKSGSTTIINGLDRWPTSIPYVIDSNSDFTQFHKEIIQEVMMDFAMVTPIQFVERQNEHYYVKIISAPVECGFAFNGRASPREVMLDTSESCMGDSTKASDLVRHELMHAIGFMHEHQRQDRDQCITLGDLDCLEKFSKEKPKSKFYYAYLIFSGNFFGEPYEYSSTMHYTSQPVCGSDVPNFLPTTPGVDPSVLGNATFFTQIEINQMYRMYGLEPVQLPNASPSVTCNVTAVKTPKVKKKYLCFSGSNIVLTPSGEKLVNAVKVGDKILSYNANLGKTEFQEVYFVPKFWPDVEVEEGKYVQISTENGDELMLSINHLMHACDDNLKCRQIPAAFVHPGMYALQQGGNSTTRLAKIMRKEFAATQFGAYNFEVTGGSPMVSGIAVSSFTDTLSNPALDRFLRWPVRIAFLLKLYEADSEAEDGMQFMLRFIAEIVSSALEMYG